MMNSLSALHEQDGAGGEEEQQCITWRVGRMLTFAPAGLSTIRDGVPLEVDGHVGRTPRSRARLAIARASRARGRAKVALTVAAASSAVGARAAEHTVFARPEDDTAIRTGMAKELLPRAQLRCAVYRETLLDEDD